MTTPTRTSRSAATTSTTRSSWRSKTGRRATRASTRSASTSSLGEYRTLHAAYREIQDVKFPVVVKTTAPSTRPRGRRRGADETTIGGAPLDEATSWPRAERALQRRAPGRKETDVTLADVDQTSSSTFIAAGKKGIAVKPYKGLGEMNPETLWTTTMDPDNRRCLQVRREDHCRSRSDVHDADGLTGRAATEFLEDNALDVRNLDV
jgi:DNA gyrase/topoisomerase IV subunit B